MHMINSLHKIYSSVCFVWMGIIFISGRIVKGKQNKFESTNSMNEKDFQNDDDQEEK